jgi:fructose-1,6-bisphosphatase
LVPQKSDLQKNIFIREKRNEFSMLEGKFEKMTDPIERYIKRQEMMKIRNELEPYGVKLEIP